MCCYGLTSDAARCDTRGQWVATSWIRAGSTDDGLGTGWVDDGIGASEGRGCHAGSQGWCWGRVQHRVGNVAARLQCSKNQVISLLYCLRY